MGEPLNRPYGTFVVGRVRKPGVETPGYSQMSLRDTSWPVNGYLSPALLKRRQVGRALPGESITIPIAPGRARPTSLSTFRRFDVSTF